MFTNYIPVCQTTERDDLPVSGLGCAGGAGVNLTLSFFPGSADSSWASPSCNNYDPIKVHQCQGADLGKKKKKKDFDCHRWNFWDWSVGLFFFFFNFAPLTCIICIYITGTLIYLIKHRFKL